MTEDTTAVAIHGFPAGGVRGPVESVDPYSQALEPTAATGRLRTPPP